MTDLLLKGIDLLALLTLVFGLAYRLGRKHGRDEALAMSAWATKAIERERARSSGT